MSPRSRAAYAAGFFDAEGTVYASSSGVNSNGSTMYNLRIAVSNNVTAPLKWLQKHFGGSVFGIKTGKDWRWAQPHRWELYGHRAQEAFLTAIAPYCSVKRNEVDLALEWIGLHGQRCPDERLELIARLKDAKMGDARNTQTIPTISGNRLQAYCAGFFDGEGCLAMWRQDGRYKYSITAAGTCVNPLDRLRARFGGTIRSSESSDTRQEVYHWNLGMNKDSGELFLLAMLPYFLVKTDQAKQLLRFIRDDNTADEKERILLTLKDLKRHSEPVETNTSGSVDLPSIDKIEPVLVSNDESASAVTLTA